MQPSSVRIGNMNRDTKQPCPHCQRGTILDKRGSAVTKDTPFWSCSNSSKDCSYTEKYSKKWQWVSWEWETPYFIEMSETEEQKKDRHNYEEKIIKIQKAIAETVEIEEEINDNIRYCRLCGLRNCQKINNCS